MYSLKESLRKDLLIKENIENIAERENKIIQGIPKTLRNGHSIIWLSTFSHFNNSSTTIIGLFVSILVVGVNKKDT